MGRSVSLILYPGEKYFTSFCCMPLSPASSSMTTWKFVPPNPKALTLALRGFLSIPSGQSSGSVITLKGMLPKSILGFGVSKCSEGGSILLCRASAVLMIEADPAAALRWPIIDFTDPSPIELFFIEPLSHTLQSVSASTASPTDVDVPCASMSCTVSGVICALSRALRMASICPLGLGAVIPFPLPSLEAPMPLTMA